MLGSRERRGLSYLGCSGICWNCRFGCITHGVILLIISVAYCCGVKENFAVISDCVSCTVA